MRFNAVLSNQQHPEYGVATIPFPIPKDEYENVLVLLEPLEIGDAMRQDCRIEEIRSDWQVLKQMETTQANLDELDYLAKRLDSFDDYEMTQFQGMASRLKLYGAEELINLSFCCQDVTVVTNFEDFDAIGRRHFLMLNGGCAVSKEMQNKYFRQLALNLIESEVGRVTPYGVVYDNNFEMSQLYDGRHFPQYLYESCVLEVEMRPHNAPEDSPGTFLCLPLTQTQIERAMLRTGINCYADMRLRFMGSELPVEIEVVLDMEHTSLTELNELCRVVEPLTPLARTRLGAAVLLAQPESASQVRQLAENLDQFDFVLGVQTPQEYGKYMIKESENFEYDENLEDYYDFEKYGRERMEHEGGVFNQRGYIAYQGTLSLDELMMDDPVQEQGMEMGGME